MQKTKIFQAEVFRVVQLTDLHLLADPCADYRGKNTRANFLAVLKLAKRLQPDLLLLTGDLAEDEQHTTYQWLQQQLKNSGLNWQWLPGNHDNPALMAHFKPTDFYQKTQHWQLLGLNSHWPNHTQGQLNAQQLERIQQALTNPKPLLIALHHPPVAVGSLWKDSLALHNTAEFWALLKDQQQAKLVLFGHVHQAFSGKHHHSQTLATPATSIEFTADSDQFSISPSSQPGLRFIRLQTAGRFSSRVLYLKGSTHQSATAGV